MSDCIQSLIICKNSPVLAEDALEIQSYEDACADATNGGTAGDQECTSPTVLPTLDREVVKLTVTTQRPELIHCERRLDLWQQAPWQSSKPHVRRRTSSSARAGGQLLCQTFATCPASKRLWTARRIRVLAETVLVSTVQTCLKNVIPALTLPHVSTPSQL